MNAAFTGFNTGMLDFPNKLAMTLFFNGCNFNCRFCHNKRVVFGKPTLSLEDVAEPLSQMQKAFHSKKIGVVLSGGEPTVHPEFMNAIRFFHGRPMALQSNGFMLPQKISNPFESVILSLKPMAEVPRGVNASTYVRRMVQAFEYYDSANYRELRIVDFPEHKDDYETTLGRLPGDLLDRWTIQWVQPNKEVQQ